MRKITVRPATMDDIAPIVANIREADRRECLAQTLLQPADAIAFVMRTAVRAWVGLVDGRHACIFGVSPTSVMTREWGIPWLIATPLLEDNGRYVARYAKKYLAEMLECYPKLENHVDARNVTAVNWLGWLGFEIQEAKPAGPLGRMFHHFTLEA